jgi:hypothetical protein
VRAAAVAEQEEQEEQEEGAARAAAGSEDDDDDDEEAAVAAVAEKEEEEEEEEERATPEWAMPAPQELLQPWERLLDLVVATPGGLLRHLRRGEVSLSAATTVVIDEADAMLDGGFMAELVAVLRASRYRAHDKAEGETQRERALAVLAAAKKAGKAAAGEAEALAEVEAEVEAARAAAAALELVPLPPCVYIAVGASHPPAVQQLYRRMFGGAIDNEAAALAAAAPTEAEQRAA